MQRLGLVERARELAPYVEGKLKELKAKHPSVGDVRGKGLFWAVDLVKNRDTKEPFNTYSDKVSGKPLLVDQIAAKMLADGVMIQAWVSHFVDCAAADRDEGRDRSWDWRSRRAFGDGRCCWSRSELMASAREQCSRQPKVGIVVSTPLRIPVGQRDVTVFIRV